MYVNVCSSSIHNSPKVETIPISITWRTGSQNVVYPRTGVVLRSMKGRTLYSSRGFDTDLKTLQVLPHPIQIRNHCKNKCHWKPSTEPGLAAHFSVNRPGRSSSHPSDRVQYSSPHWWKPSRLLSACLAHHLFSFRAESKVLPLPLGAALPTGTSPLPHSICGPSLFLHGVFMFLLSPPPFTLLLEEPTSFCLSPSEKATWPWLQIRWHLSSYCPIKFLHVYTWAPPARQWGVRSSAWWISLVWGLFWPWSPITNTFYISTQYMYTYP